MQFAEMHMGYLFWLVIVCAGLLFWARQYKKRKFGQLVAVELQTEIAASLDPRKENWKDYLKIGILIFCVLALMRPQWGFEWQEIKRQGLDIFIAMDVSKSMLTQDVKPNRLERSKLAILDLIKRLNGDRVGLIAFAGDAFLMCPLTVDYSGFLLSLEDLTTDSVPKGGTNLGRAIEEAMKGYGNVPNKYKAVILITDGENLEGDAVAWAKRAKDKGIKIFCVGIGTQEGELIQYQNEAGQMEFLKDRDGNFVKSRLEEEDLQQIALTADGTYVRASGAQFGLELIY